VPPAGPLQPEEAGSRRDDGEHGGAARHPHQRIAHEQDKGDQSRPFAHEFHVALRRSGSPGGYWSIASAPASRPAIALSMRATSASSRRSPSHASKRRTSPGGRRLRQPFTSSSGLV